MNQQVGVPPGPPLPKALQGLAFIGARKRALRIYQARYGPVFTINIPLFGRSVVVTDPAVVKQLFATSPLVAANIEPNLGRVLGEGSVFNLEADEHRARRRLLVPPFHGKRMHNYERVIEEEFAREAATWPEDAEFETMAPFMRITLNAILRAVFGAEGEEFDELRDLLPPWIEMASRLATIPVPRVTIAGWSPWAKFDAARARFDAIVGRLIDKGLADPHLPERDDVLALLLQSRYDDGSAMPRSTVADELLTLLAAGHETTATSLAWTVERLRRHPALLRRLVDEIDAGGTELTQATILEVQRTRPVIDFVGRRVKADTMPLGDWLLPRGTNVIVGVSLVHDDPHSFPNPRRFDPDRFLARKPGSNEWVPFGGGTRRCIGAAFANMEMVVVLRCLLRDFELHRTTERGERFHNRGVAWSPADGGKGRVTRRITLEANPSRPERSVAAVT